MEQKRNKNSLKELLKLVQQNIKDVDNELQLKYKENLNIYSDDREKEIDYEA